MLLDIGGGYFILGAGIASSGVGRYIPGALCYLLANEHEEMIAREKVFRSHPEMLAIGQMFLKV